jgi:hypothetical protein
VSVTVICLSATYNKQNMAIQRESKVEWGGGKAYLLVDSGHLDIHNLGHCFESQSTRRKNVRPQTEMREGE